jgi:hypothetical protein
MTVALEIAQESGTDVVGGLHGAYLGLPRRPAKLGAEMRGKGRTVLTMDAEACPAEGGKHTCHWARRIVMLC